MPFQTANLTRCAFLAIISAVLTACTPEHADFQGKVVHIVDGDTIDVLVNRQTIRVRLTDIDAPENGQAFGQRARQHLSELIFRRKVRVIEKQTDGYGRALGIVYAIQCAPLNTCFEHNVNALMVHAGMAWAYRLQGTPTNKQMYALEKEARSQRRGLWTNPNAQEPWKWRRKSKNNSN